MEEYYASLLDFAQKLNCTPEQMASYFVAGLPDNVQENVLAGDLHTLANYMQRAKMYLSRNPGHLSVSFDQSVNAVCSPTLAKELSKKVVASISDMMTNMEINKERKNQDSERRPRERRSSRERQPDRHAGRSRYRNITPYRGGLDMKHAKSSLILISRQVWRVHS